MNAAQHTMEEQEFLDLIAKAEQAEKQKSQTESQAPKSEVEIPLRKFQKIEKKSTSRGIQSFFRTAFDNHVQFASNADNKAHIMISVNSILISVIISFAYRQVTNENPRLLMPVVIFLVTSVASLIFAVLSARPKATMLNQDQTDIEKIKENIFSFGNFMNLSSEQYEEAVDKVLRNEELIYGNMARDLYHLGKILEKKYRFLTVSYDIFMIGFVTTVMSFIYISFFP